MASTLTHDEIVTLIKDALVANTTTDTPIASGASSEMLRAMNDAYQAIWEVSGGAIKTVASATLWTSAQSATGVVTGALAGVKDILHLFASTTSDSTGTTAGDVELDKRDLGYIQRLRKMDISGTYAKPKVYAITRLEATSPAAATASTVGLLQLDYFPSVAGFYFPAIYVPEFTPLDGGASDCPTVTDIESRDIAWMAAADLAPRIGRSSLVPSILMKVSDATNKLLAPKLRNLLVASQKAA